MRGSASAVMRAGSNLARVTATPRQRIVAALIDAPLMVAWAAIVTAGFVAASIAGSPVRLGPFGYHLLTIVVVVLPVTIALSAMEAGRYEATPGKLRVGLRVRRDPSGDRVGWGRCFVRNLLKLGLPWVLSQSALLALASTPGWLAAVGTLIAVAVPAAYLVSLFVGQGKTVYDWLTDTMVIRVQLGRRFASEPDEPMDDVAAAVPVTPIPPPSI